MRFMIAALCAVFLIVGGASGQESTRGSQVQGTSSDNLADVGKPVKVGGRYNATVPTYATGDRADSQVTSRGLQRGEWRPSNQADEVIDDSDKALTVPAATEWTIQSIRVELITSADAGARQLAIQVRDAADDIILEMIVGDTQIESLTRIYNFFPGAPDLTAERDTTSYTTPFPVLVLPTGFDIRVFDNNAVAAAADDMVIQMLVLAREDLG